MKLMLYISTMSGGGAERVFLNLGKYFIERGYPVTLVLNKRKGELLKEAETHFDVHVLQSESEGVLLSQFTSIKRFRSILLEQRPDILMATLPHSNIIAGLSKYIFRGEFRLILREANPLNGVSDLSVFTRFFYLNLLRFSYRKARHVVANSKVTKNDLVKFNVVAENAVTVIGNPLIGAESNVHQDGSIPCLLADIREMGQKVFIACGRLDPQKDYPSLLRAFKLVRSRVDAKLVILGSGNEEVRLKELSEALEISNDVYFPGFVPNVREWFSGSDVFVLSSHYEGFGNVVVEALNAGLTVVATRSGGPEDILEDGKYGYLVPAGDSRALAEKMLYALKNPYPASKCRTRAADYKVDIIGRQYENLFAE